MKRWPFAAVAAFLFGMNLFRLNSNEALRVWSDPVCAIFFVGYLICVAIAIAIKSSTPAPPAGP